MEKLRYAFAFWCFYFTNERGWWISILVVLVFWDCFEDAELLFRRLVTVSQPALKYLRSQHFIGRRFKSPRYVRN